jgi:excisionase family DNA binding protein
MNEQDWMDQDAALAFLGVSRPTLYRWIRDGRLPAYRAGRQLRFDRGELERFIRGTVAAVDPLLADVGDALAFFEERAQRRAARSAGRPPGAAGKRRTPADKEHRAPRMDGSKRRKRT